MVVFISKHLIFKAWKGKLVPSQLRVENAIDEVCGRSLRFEKNKKIPNNNYIIFT